VTEARFFRHHSHPGRFLDLVNGETGCSMSGADDRGARAARNQSLFREINERVKQLNDGFSMVLPVGEWICECADDTCVVPVELSAQEYEAVRADSKHFIVSASDAHVFPDVERVTERSERYWVVEKFGRAGEVADQFNPR
jgi:hypothetical protein